MISYYIYYRVEPGRADALRGEIERLFEAVEGVTGVRGRWMRRRDEPSTYMEIYENVPDSAAFEALLERETTRLGLQRHTERFVCA